MGVCTLIRPGCILGAPRCIAVPLVCPQVHLSIGCEVPSRFTNSTGWGDPLPLPFIQLDCNFFVRAPLEVERAVALVIFSLAHGLSVQQVVKKDNVVTVAVSNDVSCSWSSAIMNFLLIANEMLVLYIAINLFKLYYGDDWEGLFGAITSYGLRSSSMALFGSAGIGIYILATDVGVDLIRKVERNILEDDPLISSVMFLIAMVSNPLSVNLVAGEIGKKIGWIDWALVALVLGLISLIVIPLLLYVIYPSTDKSSSNAPKITRENL
eukprot:Gb_41295 [translate_table: standard]